MAADSTPGKGTEISIYLPTARKRQTLHQYKYVSESLPLGSEHILLVDDEPQLSRMGGQVLERLGYAVTTSTSSTEALELFRSKPYNFNLVITDMTMPNMTGDQLAIEMMKIRDDIPVILCTGYSKKISDDAAKRIGIRAFAFKPIVKAELALTVRRVLDQEMG